MTDVISMEDVLKKAEGKPTKRRTRNTTETKKVKKITKKEQEILNLAQSLQMPDNYHLINTEELFMRFLDHYKMYKTMFPKPYIYLDTETYGLNTFKDQIISISFGFDSNQFFNIPLRPFLHESSLDVPTLPMDFVIEHIKPLLEESEYIVMANAKFDIHVLYNWCGIDITYNIYWDTMIAGGLLNENHPKGLKEWYKNYALPDLVKRGVIQDESTLPTFKFGSMFDKIPFDSVPWNLANYYACHDSFMTQAVFKYQENIFLNPVFELDKVFKLFREVEMPLIAVLATAERKGVALDVEFLKDEIGDALKRKERELLHSIYVHIGSTITLTKKRTRSKNKIKYTEEYEVTEPLNLGSPKQLSQRLYKDLEILPPVMEYDRDLGMEVAKFKTDKKTLERNKKSHPVIPLILEWRGVSKLISAFTEALPEKIEGNLDGKVHTSYNQLVKTGRMSSSDPNLQQVPSKFDVIRMAFRADKGRLLASLDFSQQELRWLAIFSKDPALLEVYQKGLDMHSRITCQVKGFDYDLFETIRNFKQETDEETQAEMARIISEYTTHPNMQHMLSFCGVVELNTETIPVMADAFELIRKKMKSVTFGTVYGISEIGLADQLLITKEEAKELIDGFKAGLPGYLVWEQKIHNKIKKDMYVEDILGRKRRFAEDIMAAKATEDFKKRGWHWKISRCLRQGGNYQIQGSSASQVKRAIIDLHYPLRPDGTRCLDRREWLREGYVSLLEKHDSNLVLQIHDELVFDVPDDIQQPALQEFAHTMANAVDVSWSGIGFKSDIEVAPYWAGKFTMEELQAVREGRLNWKERMMAEAKAKIAKNLGDGYSLGMFAEALKGEDDDDDEDVAV